MSACGTRRSKSCEYVSTHEGFAQRIARAAGLGRPRALRTAGGDEDAHAEALMQHAGDSQSDLSSAHDQRGLSVQFAAAERRESAAADDPVEARDAAQKRTDQKDRQLRDAGLNVDRRIDERESFRIGERFVDAVGPEAEAHEQRARPAALSASAS
jgi:hypothetical protein